MPTTTQIRKKRSGYKQERQVTYEEMKVIGAEWRLIRQAVGISLDEMSFHIGVYRGTYSRWERGKYIPNLDINFVTEIINDVIQRKKEGRLPKWVNKDNL